MCGLPELDTVLQIQPPELETILNTRSPELDVIAPIGPLELNTILQMCPTEVYSGIHICNFYGIAQPSVEKSSLWRSLVMWLQISRSLSAIFLIHPKM